MGCVKRAGEHVHKLWHAWEMKYFSLGRIFSGIRITWWSTSWVHICFDNIKMVWRLPHSNTGRSVHMLLGPLGARGQADMVVPPGVPGDLSIYGGTHSVCGMKRPLFLQAVTQLGLVRLWEIFLFIELSLMIDVPMHWLLHAWPVQAQKKSLYNVSPRFVKGFS